MNTAPRLIIVLVLLIVAPVAFSQESRVTVSVGHAGEVRDVAGRHDLDLAFSVGDDGKLLIWNLEHEGLQTAWQLSHHPVTRIALHPERTEAVVFVREGLTTGRLLGFNWETGEEVFSTPLDARPDVLAYSPQGTFIVYTIPSFDSIYFLDARTGSPRSFLEKGFGIVSFVHMARSEDNVLTYVPSRGEFIYWQLESGSERLSVPTLARLTHLTLVDEDTQRFLAAGHEDELVVVDNLNGETLATYPVSPIHDITYDSVSDRILVLTEQSGERRILAFTYSSGRLRRAYFQPQNFSETTAAIRPVGTESERSFMGGDTDGEIALYETRYGRRTVLGPAAVTPIVDIGVTPGRLHLSTGNEIISIVSDLFEPEQENVAATSVRDTRIDVSEPGETQFVPDGERLLLWGADEPGSLWQLLPPSSLLERVYDDKLDVPIARVTATDAGPLIIHRDGRIVQVSHDSDGTERFRYTARGVQDALWDPQLGLIAAKTRAGTFDSSLMIVDPLTGETVGAETDAFLTTRIALDGRTTTLYAIGLYGPQSRAETRLIRLTGNGFGRSATLATIPYEASRGDLFWDDQTSSLYSSMGYYDVYRQRGLSQETFESVERLHSELTAGGLFVFSRNLDGTVTMWNRADGEHVADIYVLDDEWIAITKGGSYLTSSPAAERYLTFLPAPRTRWSLEDFRFTAPFEQ